MSSMTVPPKQPPKHAEPLMMATTRTSSVKSKDKYLACPFFKHNPARYVSDGGCSGGAWPTVHRLKSDHISKYHQLPGTQCRRCGEIIDDGLGISQHSRCEERLGFETREGADSFMMQKLSDKSIVRGRTEEDKWKAVYGILFPHVAISEYPSPYYELPLDVRRGIYNWLQTNIKIIVPQAVHDLTLAPTLQDTLIRNITSSLLKSAAGSRPLNAGTPQVNEKISSLGGYHQAQHNAPLGDASRHADIFTLNEFSGKLNTGADTDELTGCDPTVAVTYEPNETLPLDGQLIDGADWLSEGVYTPSGRIVDESSLLF
ncbi:hypothetical protein F5Y04DRAFT_288454 [Hypomontagnella monticulosa]|nr:hypothetical protein F5Y04DRAFT_288454 [Hypomontagnella monticulosa]